MISRIVFIFFCFATLENDRIVIYSEGNLIDCINGTRMQCNCGFIQWFDIITTKFESSGLFESLMVNNSCVWCLFVCVYYLCFINIDVHIFCVSPLYTLHSNFIYMSMLITRLINEFYIFFVSDIVVECSRKLRLATVFYISMFISCYCRLMLIKWLWNEKEKHSWKQKSTRREKKKNMINSEPTLLRMLYNKCITDNIATTIT